MNDDGLHADIFHQRDILSEKVSQILRRHRRSTILYHHGLPPEPTNVWERLH
jgi:hypothetical protein